MIHVKVSARQVMRRIRDLAEFYAHVLDVTGLQSPDISLPKFPETLQQQLGLRLDPETGLVNVLVIDHIEQPSTNYVEHRFWRRESERIE